MNEQDNYFTKNNESNYVNLNLDDVGNTNKINLLMIDKKDEQYTVF